MPGRALDVYLEVGSKRAFACAVDWPGWCRRGTDEASALQALFDSAPLYAAVVRSTRLGFEPPKRLEDLRVVERLRGNATTDFGAPGVIPKADLKPAEPSDVERLEKLLRAAWRAFDRARERAEGKELRKGPRGGGRELDAIVKHVMEAELGYLGALGWKARPSGKAEERLAEIRKAAIEGLRASARGEIPAKGPRGGTRWPARYFARRTAWHSVAHAWEIERRVLP